jgi:hypothetical protein
MTLDELESAILKLDPRARAMLATRLLESLDTLSDAESERLWADEAMRREEEIESGAVIPRPAEDVFREARARLS